MTDNPSDADKLKILNRKRGTIKAQQTAFKTFLENVNAPVSDSQLIDQIERRFHAFENLLDSFNDIQSQIELLVTDDEFENALQERNNFESHYYELLARAAKLLSCKQDSVDPPVSEMDRIQLDRQSNTSRQTSPAPSEVSCTTDIDSSRNVNLSNHVRLPILNLNNFNGKVEDFPAFADAFKSLVHNNEKLDDIARFLYLKSFLSHEPLKVIESIEVTESNYKLAWNLLEKRYRNKKLMIHNHIKGIIDFPKMSKESFTSLREFLDTIQSHIRSLSALGEPVEQWDSLLIYIATDKFAYLTKREWEIELGRDDSEELPDYNKLIDFLERRCRLLEKIDKNYTSIDNDNAKNKNTSKLQKPSRTLTYVSTKASPSKQINISCPVCHLEHYIYQCKIFLDMPVSRRQAEVKKHSLCTNCLRKGHDSTACKSGCCKKCSQHHSTLLHVEFVPSAPPLSTLNTHMNILQNFKQILATAQIVIRGNNSSSLKCIALLDCGSMRSYISSSLCQRLSLETTNVDISVVGINQTKTNISQVANARIGSLNEDFIEELTFLVLPKITETFAVKGINHEELKLPSNIKLANCHFSKGARIDVLLGVDIFWKLIKPEQPYLRKYPFLINSVLGYIISGNFSADPSHNNNSTHCNFSLSKLSKQVSRFWEQEDCSPSSPILSIEEQQCEENFLKTTTRDANGRFVVKLPLVNSPCVLGESKTKSIKQFLALEKRLLSKPDIRSMYIDFMSEYERLGHMVKIDSDLRKAEYEYFMPHHPVIKEDSLTTKLRVVFNSSAPSSNGLSLNDIQMNGPIIQNDLFSIILRFRRFKYILSADCSKMFRCVLVHPEHRPLQKIIWRADPSHPLDTYELCTVTYGQKASSFLAIRCLCELANIHESKHPLISGVIKNDMYCDDLLCSTDSLSTAQYICQTISEILKSGGFILRKWTTNVPELLNQIDKNDISNKILDFGPHENTKTLGLLYSPFSDKLLFTIREFNSTSFTKRSVLSFISQIFDPLGLLGPCTIIAKIFIQQLWTENLSWDEPIKDEILSHWLKFVKELPFLNSLTIPRHALLHNFNHLEIHCFCDASLKAFGGCVFLKSKDSSNNVSSHLLCSKTKVAPLQTLTIPKLELNAALLVAKLAHKVKNALEVTVDRIVFWTDSQITLAWIKTEPYRLKMYVANRVSQIHSLCDPNGWKYVPSDLNPADLLTRGVKPSVLKDTSLWWQGPSFLIENESAWPKLAEGTSVPEIPELKNIVSTHLSNSDLSMSFPFERFSSLNKIKRVAAYCLRFIKNCRNSEGSLTTQTLNCIELNEAFLILIEISQHESFSSELQCLQRKIPLKKGSKLSSLTPFIDNAGIIRLGGRLNNSEFEFDKKHPIILSSKHPLTSLIFQHEHKKLCHAGPQLLLATIRERYWIIGGRSLAKFTVRKCIQCFRVKPKHIEHILGHLPSDRVKPHHPFEIVGSDFAGPIYIKNNSRKRNQNLEKSYILIFVCFTTKAVHLEIVSNLTTECFILALRRFAARRGMPAKIYSDNGKTYLGATSHLRELGEYLISQQNELQNAFVNEQFNWNFIPPYSPHMGGLWEAGIKSTKQHLKKVLGNTSLNFEQFCTLLIQIEGILNSRPLFPLSSHPDDLNPLTPSHLLIGRTITSVPDPDVTHIPVSRLNVYQHIQYIIQHFWKRWSMEYISELQRRTKWKDNAPNIREGTLVLIKDDSVPPTHWRMGRVETVHPGKDGVVRVVSLRTSSGIIKRSTARICPLPLEDDIKNNSATKCLCVGLMSLCKCVCALCEDKVKIKGQFTEHSQ